MADFYVHCQTSNVFFCAVSHLKCSARRMGSGTAGCQIPPFLVHFLDARSYTRYNIERDCDPQHNDITLSGFICTAAQIDDNNDVSRLHEFNLQN